MSRISRFLEQYPNAKIMGGSILAIKAGLGDVATPYFEQAGLGDLEVEEFYDFRLYLQVIQAVIENEPDIMSNLVSIGIRVIETAPQPPKIDSLEKALMGLQAAWEINTRDANKINWETKKIDDKTFICTNYSPFPKDMEYGVLYGYTKHFAEGKYFTVKYEDLADRDNEDKDVVNFIVQVE